MHKTPVLAVPATTGSLRRYATLRLLTAFA